MDVKAILLLESQPQGFGLEVFGGAHIAAVDVLGRSVVLRTIDRLFAAGCNAVWVAGDSGTYPLNSFRASYSAGDVVCLPAPGAQLWRAAESAFTDAVAAGADVVIVQRIGAYAEFDYDALVEFHITHGNRVTPVEEPDGAPLDTFVISASRRNDAAFLFRRQLQQLRIPGVAYRFSGYCNPLRNARNLRQLSVDGLHGSNAVKPCGKEIRPGIWLGEGARIYKGARVLAPAYVGDYSRVRATAVVTRYGVLEHHVDVDCGTVVEDANVLPYTRIGSALDVAHSVVGNKRVLHLKREAEVEIADPRLLSSVSTHAPLRAVTSAAALVAFVPKQMLRGLLARRQRACPTDLTTAVQAPATALQAPAAQRAAEEAEATRFAGNLMVARRYGNE